MRQSFVICLFVALVCCAAECRAQRIEDYIYSGGSSRRMEMGLSVGGSYLLCSMPDAINAKPKLGVKAALQMAYLWQERYGLQLEVGYLYNKIEAGRGAEPLDAKSNVVEVPLLFSYRPLYWLRFNLGPQLSLGGTSRYDMPNERVEFGSLRSTLGYVAGVGVSLSEHLLVEARYTGNFAQTMNYFEGLEFESRASWLTLSIGYMF